MSKRHTSFRIWVVAVPFAIAAGVSGYAWYARASDPLRRLATIYASGRTLELRMPGASHGPLRIRRGAASISGEPEQLLRVAADTARRLQQSPNSPLWLHAKGRVAILEWEPQEAIEALQAAEDLGREDPALRIDLASAYYERGQRFHSAADLNKAEDLLGQALRSDPRSAAALFNRAIVEGELQQFGPAVADLERVLSIETRGEWSNEARDRLAQARQKRAAFFDRPPGEDERRFDEVALDALLQSPERLFSEGPALAQRLRTGHQDPWLAELLALPRTPATVQAIAELGRMSVIRITVEKGRYVQEKSAFEAIAAIPQPTAIAAWIAYESLFRATHTRDNFPCPASSQNLLALTGGHHYGWLEAQIRREQAYCAFQAGDIDAAEHLAAESNALARQYVFPVAAVRAEAISANTKLRRGQFREAIDSAIATVEHISAERLPVARSQDFYFAVMSASESLSRWHAALQSAAAMTAAARAAGFRDLQFNNTVHWAQLALRCGERRQAAELFTDALSFYSTLAPADDRAWAEVGFADATGDESRLGPFADQLEAAKSSMIWVPYQRVRARLALANGRRAEARDRLTRIEQWLDGPFAGANRLPTLWLSEFRAAAQVFLSLLIEERRIPQAFQFLQKCRRVEERALDPVSQPARAASGGAAVIAFATVGSSVGAWMRDSASLEFRWAGESAEIDRLARRFHRLSASPKSAPNEVESAARQLGNILFGQLLSRLPARQPLLIQADGVLAEIPFAALPGRDGPLGLERAVAITPFAVPERTATEGGAPTGDVLVVNASRVVPAWAHELPPLPDIAGEVETIRRFSPAPIRELAGDRATAEALAQGSRGAAVLHFAGHAVRTGAGMSLILADAQAPVALSDLTRLGFQSPARVVLSACSTAGRLAADADDSGPQSLAINFLSKGSGEAIASLWDVNSTATGEFMKALYEALSEGEELGNAMRRAMARVRGLPGFSHPYYWAAFTRFIRA